MSETWVAPAHPPLRRPPRAWFAVVVAACALTACGLSTAEEDEIGDRYAAMVQREVPLFQDPASVRYLEQLGRRVVSVADRDNRDWHFYIVDDTVVNAFAIPGGHIFVNRGLIARAGSYHELAGVLGHEVAHVTLRHSTDQLKLRQRANIFLTVFCTLVDVCGSPVGQLAIGIGGQLVFAKYSRGDESEADSAAVEYLHRTGIDPAGVPAFFGRLLAERNADPTVLDAWLGSHPLEEDRMARSSAIVARLPSGDGAPLERNRDDFVAFRERVRSLGR